MSRPRCQRFTSPHQSLHAVPEPYPGVVGAQIAVRHRVLFALHTELEVHGLFQCVLGSFEPIAQYAPIGYQQFRRFRGSCSPFVGNQIHQGYVCFVPDCTHHRRGKTGNRSNHFFGVETIQILRGAAATPDDDGLDIFI